MNCSLVSSESRGGPDLERVNLFEATLGRGPSLRYLSVMNGSTCGVDSCADRSVSTLVVVFVTFCTNGISFCTFCVHSIVTPRVSGWGMNVYALFVDNNSIMMVRYFIMRL